MQTSAIPATPILAGYDLFEGTLGPDLFKPPGVPASYQPYWRYQTDTGCQGPGPAATSVVGEATEEQAGAVITWVANLPSGNPWLAILAFNAAHSPHEPPPDDLSCVGQQACYRSRIRWMDKKIGDLRSALPPDTTYIFVGDNGDPFTFRGKGWVSEAGIHVPLIISVPDLDPPLDGTVCDALVNTTDLFTTVLDLADPDSSFDPAFLPTILDSVSLMPLLEKTCAASTLSVREYIYADFDSGADTAPHHQDSKAIRNREGHKLRIDHFPFGPGSSTWYFFPASSGSPDTSVNCVDPDTGVLLDPLPPECTAPELAGILADLKARLGDPGTPSPPDADGDDVVDLLDPCLTFVNTLPVNRGSDCQTFAQDGDPVDPNSDCNEDRIPSECQCGDTFAGAVPAEDNNGRIQAGDSFAVAGCVTNPGACIQDITLSDTDNNGLFQAGDAFNIATVVSNPGLSDTLTCGRRPEGTEP